tara:strand:+ start:53374 stop:54525 length:1152 start_codon:yes stop_codon:yes gene_type:complete
MIKCWATENSVQIDPQGFVRPCCKFEGNFGKFENYDSIDAILNGKDYTLLRKRHSLGNMTKACWRCKEAEDRGYRSRRQAYETRYSENDFQLDISPGLYCNLKCRMCGPINSTGWFSDNDKLYDLGIHGMHSSKYNVYNMPQYDVDKIVKFIESNTKNIDIELKGGEPLMLPATKHLLQTLSKWGDRIQINMITNGTYTPDWLPNILEKFRMVTIGISADGVGEVYNYIRGDEVKNTWKVFQKNISWYKKLKCKIRFNFTLQNTNIHHLYKFANEVGAENVHVINLVNPKFNSIKIIPKQARAYILDQVEPWIDILGKHHLYYQKKDALIIKKELLRDEEVDLKLYNEYITYNAHLDKLRSQNLLEVVPHLITTEGRKLYESI